MGCLKWCWNRQILLILVHEVQIFSSTIAWRQDQTPHWRNHWMYRMIITKHHWFTYVQYIWSKTGCKRGDASWQIVTVRRVIMIHQGLLLTISIVTAEVISKKAKQKWTSGKSRPIPEQVADCDDPRWIVKDIKLVDRNDPTLVVTTPHSPEDSVTFYKNE